MFFSYTLHNTMRLYCFLLIGRRGNAREALHAKQKFFNIQIK